MAVKLRYLPDGHLKRACKLSTNVIILASNAKLVGLVLPHPGVSLKVRIIHPLWEKYRGKLTPLWTRALSHFHLESSKGAQGRR